MEEVPEELVIGEGEYMLFGEADHSDSLADGDGEADHAEDSVDLDFEMNESVAKIADVEANPEVEVEAEVARGSVVSKDVKRVSFSNAVNFFLVYYVLFQEFVSF